MSVIAESIRIKIGGNEFSIKTDADVETTKRIAEFVDRKMNELRRTIATHDNLKLAIVTALNIAEELLDFKEKYKIMQIKLSDLEKRTIGISEKIDSGIRIFDQ